MSLIAYNLLQDNIITLNNRLEHPTLTSIEFSRPANTTAYSVNDVISDSTSVPSILTFSNISFLHKRSEIIKVRLFTNNKNTAAQFRLHLYKTAPTPTAADNVAFPLLYSNAINRIGFIDFDTTQTEDSTTSTGAFASHIYSLPFLVENKTQTSLYGILETKTAFTPTSGQTFFISLLVQ